MLTKIENLLAEIVKYLQTRGELVRIKALERISRLLSWMIILIIGVLILLFAVAFVAVGIALLLAKLMPLWAACLVTSCVFIGLFVLLIVFRNKIVLNPIVKRMSSILYSDSLYTEDEDNV